MSLGRLCAASLLLAAGLGLVQGQQESAPINSLPAFSNVQICVPFNVLITPSSGGPAFGYQVSADPAATAAITAAVTGDTLQLETGGFTSQQPIKVVIYMPPDQLKALDHMGQVSAVYVDRGFNVDSFKLRMASGSGSVYVYGMTANSADVQSQSSGDVVLTGSYGSVSVATSGISSVYVAGVSQAVDVALNGISNLYLQPASSSVAITGMASGISSVQYTQGQCSVQSAFLLTSPCQQTSAINLQAPTPTWTQGLTAIGGFSCAGGSSFLTTQQPFLQIPQISFPQIPQIRIPVFQPAPMVITPAPTPAPTPTPTASPTEAAGTAESIPSGALLAAPPMPEAAPGAPYAYQLQTPTGSQFQAGSATPQASSAQSAATGQRQASASSVAGPGVSRTATTSDGTGFTAGTGAGSGMSG